MKKKVLILSGGISKERLISLDTGLQVAKELKKNGYKIKISEPDKNLEKTIKNFKPGVIFNALHGQFGEDGYIQSILEKFKIPYTHSGVIASSLAMDKEISKKIFIKNKIEPCGDEGHWLEKMMGIKPNSNNEPDIYGYEQKKDSKKIN